MHAAGPQSTSSSAKARQIQTRQKQSMQQRKKPGAKPPTARWTLLAGAFKAKSFQRGPSPGTGLGAGALHRARRWSRAQPPSGIPSTPKAWLRRTAAQAPGGNHTGPCKQQQLRSGARKPQIKPCTAGISLCPLVFPLQLPLSLVPSLTVPSAESGHVPQPGAEGQEWGTADTALPPTEGLRSNVTCAISRALVLLLPVIFWFSVTGSDNRRCCCDVTPRE